MRKYIVKSVYFIAIMLIALMHCFIKPAMAIAMEDDGFHPEISLKQGYNDNIFMDDKDQVRAHTTTASPSLVFLSRSERHSAMLTGECTQRIYHDYSDLNGLDQRYNGSFQYSIDEFNRFSAGVGYEVTSGADRDIYTSGIIFDTSEREKLSGNGGWQFSFSETQMYSVSFYYTDLTYENDGSTESYNDYTAYSCHAGTEFWPGSWFEEKTRGSLYFGYDRYEYTNSTIDNYSLSTGFDGEINEIFNYYLTLGGRFTMQEYSAWSVDYSVLPVVLSEYKETDEIFSGIGSMGMIMKGEYLRSEGALEQTVEPPNGTGSTTLRTSLKFLNRLQTTENLSVNFNARYYINKSDHIEDSNDPVDEESFTISPSIRYNFTKKISVNTGYSFFYNTDHIDDEIVKRQVLSIELNASF